MFLPPEGRSHLQQLSGPRYLYTRGPGTPAVSLAQRKTPPRVYYHPRIIKFISNQLNKCRQRVSTSFSKFSHNSTNVNELRRASTNIKRVSKTLILNHQRKVNICTNQRGRRCPARFLRLWFPFEHWCGYQDNG